MEIPKTVQVVQIQCGFKIKSALTFSKLAQLWDSAESAESAGILKKVFSAAIQSRTPALSRRSATLKRPCGDGGLANPESINHHVGMLNQVLEPLIVVDKYTLEFPVEQFVMGWREINLAWISIHSKKAVEDMGRDKALLNPIGTGVFAMSEWIADNKFVGEANVDYWGTVPSFDNLIVLEVPEASTRVAMIKTGAVGIIDGVGFSFAKGLTEAGITPTSANKGGQSQVISFAGNYWQKKHHETGEPVPPRPGFKPDDDHPWIGDPDDPERMESALKVRQAMALAIDRELINEEVLLGQGRPEYLPITAVFNNDFPLLAGSALVFAVVYVFAAFLMDMSYAVVDPRIRYD